MTQFVRLSKNKTKRERERERDWVEAAAVESDPSRLTRDVRQPGHSAVVVSLCTNAASCQLEPSVHVWSQTFCCLGPSVRNSAVFFFLHRHRILLNYSELRLRSFWHLTESGGGVRSISMWWPRGEIKTLVAIL